MSLPTVATIDTLMAHADWVRALARHLVRDPGTADDVEQEVWRAAIERPPTHAANPRGWLASVARNAARQLKRGDARRTKRESAVARPEALPSTSQLVEEASLSRELAGVVLQLDEPYRTTLLLRYYREMSIDDVARAQELSRETVRTRQRRALEMLRERLDATRGGRASWIAAFAPLTRFEVTPVAAGGGFALIAWGAAAAVLALGAWLAWPEERPATTVASLPAPGDASVSAASTVDAPRAEGPARTEVALVAPRTPSSPSANTIPSATSAPTVGRVIDTTGRPLSGVEVAARPKYAARVENGEIVIPTPPHFADGTRLEDRDRDGETIYGGETRLRIDAEEREVYTQFPDALEFRLKDLGHAPGLREALLGLPAPHVAARSDADGRFALELTSDTWTFDVTDPRLVIVTQLGQRGTDAWTLVVAPAVRVAGIVVDEAGAPVVGAQVQHASTEDELRDLRFERQDHAPTYSSRIALVDEAGRFVFERVPRFARDTVSASAPGHEGANVVVPAVGAHDLRLVLKARAPTPPNARLRGLVLHADGRPAAGASVHLGQDSTQAGDDGRFELQLSCCHEGMPLAATMVGFQAALIENYGRSKTPAQDDIVLRLGPPALSIRGRVVGPMGKPVAKAHVQLFDGTGYSNTHCYAEDAASGRLKPGVKTSASGEFELGGLFERTYRLLAWWDDQVVVISEPIAAGTSDVVLTFDPARVHPEVRGRVVSRDGTPLAGIEVAARVETYRTSRGLSSRSFGRVTTDAEGRFLLRDVHKSIASLLISGPSIRLDSRDLPADPTREFTLTAELEVRVELEVVDPIVDEVRFLDARGEEMNVILQLPDVSTHCEFVPRKDGVFPPFDLSDAAVTAVLRSKKAEVRRAPIQVVRTSTLKLRL